MFSSNIFIWNAYCAIVFCAFVAHTFFRPLPVGYSSVFSWLLFPSHLEFYSLFEFEMGTVDRMTQMLLTDDNNSRACYSLLLLLFICEQVHIILFPMRWYTFVVICSANIRCINILVCVCNVYA